MKYPDNLSREIFSSNMELGAEYHTYSRGFMFSTESANIFDGMDLRGRDILAVAAGGGDPMLYALDMGAHSVHLFDCSWNAAMAVDLKLAALRNLLIDETIKLFEIDFDKNIIGFNHDMYLKIRGNLSPTLVPTIDIMDKHGLFEHLFRGACADKAKTYRLYETPYLNDAATYNRYKKLSEYSPEFKLADNPDDLRAQYDMEFDMIYLSNILAGQSFSTSREQIISYAKMLKPGGAMITDYRYTNINAQSDFIKQQVYGNLPGMELEIKDCKPNKFKTGYLALALENPRIQPGEQPMDKVFILHKKSR